MDNLWIQGLIELLLGMVFVLAIVLLLYTHNHYNHWNK